MLERKVADQIALEEANTPALAPVEAGPAGVDGKRRRSRAWLLGAYTFLIAWGVAYLILFFTDRLPV
ncbi:MAG: hypothetical protein JSV41_08600 [Gemmatimonadota bacterium]|nr:MAG: hypothetical protein JSV41_08600 [Gemmatimonadota bacterium]